MALLALAAGFLAAGLAEGFALAFLAAGFLAVGLFTTSLGKSALGLLAVVFPAGDFLAAVPDLAGALPAAVLGAALLVVAAFFAGADLAAAA